MKKRKWIIGIMLVGYLLFILAMLTIATESRAKSKLEQAINKSYVENNLDIDVLKNNIENDIDNAQIINKETTKFPVHTVVDGHDFAIKENGNIDNNVKPEEDLPKNETKNEVIEQNTIPEEKVDIKDKETIIKYKDDVKTDKGITISTTKEGVVTISGKSTEELFIKISNNIQISNLIKTFEKWKEEDGIIIEKGKSVKQKVTMLNNTVTEGQVNVVLRTEDNQAIGIIKLLENETEYSTFLKENIIANYIYIEKNVQIDNMKFKVEITEEKHENILHLQEGSISYKGVELSIDKEGAIKLNGKSTDKLFIKITNGFNLTTDGNENIQLATTEPILFPKEDQIYIEIKELQGKCITTASYQEFNMVLKYQDGIIATNCKTKSNIFDKELLLEKNIAMVYLYISPNVVFEDYVIKPSIYKINQ